MKMNRNRDRENQAKGFTLIEILVVSIISMIVFWGAISFFQDQQEVFRRQSEQAEKQANLRIALYSLAKDLNLAGYSGTPWGVELPIFYMHHTDGVALADIPVRAIIPLSGNTVSALSGGLANQDGELLDGIEIWANFDLEGGIAKLATSVNTGDATLVGDTAGMFVKQMWDEASGANKNYYPTGIVVASYYGAGEYLPIASVDASSKTISASESLLSNYAATRDLMAPIWRRQYFVKAENGERWLIRREYYAGETVDYRMVPGVQDFQVFYDLTDPSSGQFTGDVDSADVTDPCLVTAVTIRMQAMVQTPDMVRPMLTTLNRKVKLMNAGENPNLANCPL